MIRCPFNGFSKCNGSCPFSMENLSSCLLASQLSVAVGQLRGIHQQTVNTNAQMNGLREDIDNAISAINRQEGQTDSSIEISVKSPSEYVNDELKKELIIGLPAATVYEDYLKLCDAGRVSYYLDGTQVTYKVFADLIAMTHGLVLDSEGRFTDPFSHLTPSVGFIDRLPDDVVATLIEANASRIEMSVYACLATHRDSDKPEQVSCSCAQIGSEIEAEKGAVARAISSLRKKLFTSKTGHGKIPVLTLIQDGKGSKASLYRDNIFNINPYHLR